MDSPHPSSSRTPTQARTVKTPKTAMSDNNLTILRRYAGLPMPGQVLSKSVLFSEAEDTITVYDAFPKSIFHLLVLPRSQPAPEDEEEDSSQPTLLQFVHSAKSTKPKAKQSLPTAHQVRNLPTMLSNLPKSQSKEILLKMQDAACSAKQEIEAEMIRIYGWKWDVWIGFHAIPSMEHLHLHVISADLISEKLKKKKHYNTFHPNLGFFIHVEEVLEWFDTDETFFQKKIRSLATLHPILKQELICFHCDQTINNIPTLKKHLQEEWDKVDKRKKASQARAAMFAAAAEKRRLKAEEGKKRKSVDYIEIDDTEEDEQDDNHQEKRRKTERSSTCA
ncbi:hypothetical protein CVT24_007023 [Panaeolus cyanescens]|uniref:Aprataxin C2HE/C2H2/C2HC zinc finger domain-containing protein n=1 Tax=Panaeolus cyanescens TaxID=181874 RepID=A0A409YKF1_9AGAR|nr:hypothetical protein CVT24_007023 [Panaeolus cyanescens]